MNNPKSEHLQVPNPALYHFSVRQVLKPFITIAGGIRFHGGEELANRKGSYILAPEHRSYYDIPALGLMAMYVCGVELHSMAKDELWRIRGFGKFISACGAFPVDRSKPLSQQPKTMEHIDAVVKEDGVLCIFPRGTRHKSNDTNRKSLKHGIAEIALRHGIPIVPIGIDGTEKGDRWPIYMYAGSAIEVEKTTLDLMSPKDVLRQTRPIISLLHEGLQTAQSLAALHRLEPTLRV